MTILDFIKNYQLYILFNNNQMQTSTKYLIAIIITQIILIVLVIVLSMTSTIFFFIYMTLTLVLAFCSKSFIHAAWYSFYNLMLALISLDQVGLIIIAKRPFVGKMIGLNIAYLFYFIGCIVLSYLGYLLFKQYLMGEQLQEQQQQQQPGQQPNYYQPAAQQNQGAQFAPRNVNARPAQNNENRGFVPFAGQGHSLS